ncbi:MAG: DUF4328 domain-containing protein [Campylobacteraceae bacterium]|jgi:hypothetical protein|nr:DUF4328 domain-containing protein [Campylobacteraceae bacterium]
MELSSSKKEAKTAIWFLWITVALFPFIIIEGYYLNSDEVSVKMLITAFVSLAIVCVFIISIIMFLVWFYKAYSNIYALTPDPKYKKWWVVASWLVPVVNFFVPYFILRYMYTKAADLADNPEAYKNMQKWTTLNACWALYILMWIGDIVYYALIFPDTSTLFNIITYILFIPCAWLTAKIINNYCKLEEEFLHGR